MLQQERAAQQEVAVWFVNGEPARRVVDGRRWRVVARTVQTHRGEPAYISPMVTHPPQSAVIGYEFAAVSADDGRQQLFRIRPEAERWLLR